MTRRNYDPMLLCGWLFAGIGLFFTGVGVVMCFFFDDMAAQLEGDLHPAAFIAIFLTVGLLFIVFGSFVLRALKRKDDQNRWLVENNYCILATIVDILEDYSVVVNGVPGFRAKCEYFDVTTGLTHLFVSDVRTDGLSLFKVGKALKVYIEGVGKYDYYYVDVSS